MKAMRLTGCYRRKSPWKSPSRLLPICNLLLYCHLLRSPQFNLLEESLLYLLSQQLWRNPTTHQLYSTVVHSRIHGARIHKVSEGCPPIFVASILNLYNGQLLYRCLSLLDWKCWHIKPAVDIGDLWYSNVLIKHVPSCLASLCRSWVLICTFFYWHVQ